MVCCELTVKPMDTDTFTAERHSQLTSGCKVTNPYPPEKGWSYYQEKVSMTDTGQEEFDPRDFLTSFREIAVGVLMSPRAFFQTMRRTGGIFPPFLFLLVCLLIHTLIVGLLHKDIPLLGRNLALGLTTPFITAGLTYLLLTRLFQARGTFEAAFRVNAYAAAINLLSWFPVVGVLLEFYRIYVVTVGLSATFEIKPWKALVVLVLIVGLYIALASSIGPTMGGVLS
jgi:hypothetical protein